MKKNKTQELEYLGQMLTATTESDVARIFAIANRLNELLG